MERFLPRVITKEMAAEGYNNEGLGELLGYIAKPDKHEKTCRYRITCAGDRDNPKRETCTCRIGLWRTGPRPRRASKKSAKKRARQ